MTITEIAPAPAPVLAPKAKAAPRRKKAVVVAGPQVGAGDAVRRSAVIEPVAEVKRGRGRPKHVHVLQIVNSKVVSTPTSVYLLVESADGRQTELHLSDASVLNSLAYAIRQKAKAEAETV